MATPTHTMRWEPPSDITREDAVRLSESVLGQPDIPFEEREDVFRIRVAEMDWDIGCRVYTPSDPSRILQGADGRPAGLFLLHGGASDHRYFDPIAPILAGKFGFKVVCMTYPGRLYLHDESRNWPGDTINEQDGTARTPLWSKETHVTPDQYELVKDKDDLRRRQKWGTLFLLRAKEGTEFYDRMAAWPWAFEEAMLECVRRHLPESEFSVYVHGHSTGGPFVHYLSQRLPHIAGIVGMESSPFGYIAGPLLGGKWAFPFNYVSIRTWRYLAKYRGPEAGLEGAMRLPMLMEEVFEEWDRVKVHPQFKCEYTIHYGNVEDLANAAKACAQRLGMDASQTDELVRRYQDYTRPLQGPNVRPVPNILIGLAEGSVEHKPEKYFGQVVPALEAISPPPKVGVIVFHAGVHGYMLPDEGMPLGLAPAVANLWRDAVRNGFYLSPR